MLCGSPRCPSSCSKHHWTSQPAHQTALPSALEGKRTARRGLGRLVFLPVWQGWELAPGVFARVSPVERVLWRERLPAELRQGHRPANHHTSSAPRGVRRSGGWRGSVSPLHTSWLGSAWRREGAGTAILGMGATRGKWFSALNVSLK